MTSFVVLRPGVVVKGDPHDADEYRATAARLGYGEDVAEMCRDHDPLHQALAVWLGISESYALLDAAGLLAPEDRDKAAAEEMAVIAVQRYMRIAGGRMPL